MSKLLSARSGICRNTMPSKAIWTTILSLSASLLVVLPEVSIAETPAGSTQGDAEPDFLDDLLGAEESSGRSEDSAAPERTSTQTDFGKQSDPVSADADDLLPTISVAQPDQPTTAIKEPPAYARQLEEIVVTATKRESNIRDIPASITALSGDDLEKRGAQDTTDIVKLVPGVNVTSTGDSPQRITIRGISSDIGTSPTTGILFGNVSFTDTYTPVVALDPNPFDMASVEALKGPQGTLFGASALNGAIRYVPTTPRFGEYELKWFGQYTSVSEGGEAPTYGVAVNVPLWEDIASVRVMAFDRTAPGFIDNTRIPARDSNRTDQRGARALIGWRPGDAWDVLLTTAWQQTDFRDVGIANNDEGRLETADRPRLSPNRTEYSLADLTVTWSGDGLEFVSDTSWVEKQGKNFFEASSRSTGTGALALVAQTYSGHSTTIGQEFRLLSPDDPDHPWKWVAGAFAWQQKLQNTLVVPLAVELTPLATIIEQLGLAGLGSLFTEQGSPVVVSTAADVKVEELAAFGELTRRFGQEVEVSLGGRLYRTTSGGVNEQSGLVVLANQGRSPYALKAEIEETGFNPKASILWHLSGDVLTYGLVSKGFRVGGVQTGLTGATSTAPEVFKSDTLWNYEAGIRTQFFDNTLRVDLTGFWVDWKDPQTLQPESTGLSVFLDNVGGVRSRGADISVQYLLPWGGMMLTTAATYADTVTTEDYTTADGQNFPTGTTWPLAPKWQTASTLSFNTTAGEWLLGGMATYTTIGEAIPAFGAHKVFGYEQLDLQLSLSNQRISWLPQVALILNNVTDERGLTNAFTSGVPTDMLAAEEFYYMTPRSLTVRFMGRFGN